MIISTTWRAEPHDITDYVICPGKKIMLKKPLEYNSIDVLAKIVFLVIFIVFNGFYWWYFLYLVT